MGFGKPANAKSAYNFFTSLMHEEFKMMHPGKAVDFIGFQRRCAGKWKGLSAEVKEPFEKMAALDKRRFMEEVKLFPSPRESEKEKKKKKKVKKDPNQPKRPLSAFFLFSNDRRASVKADNPDSSIGDVGKKLGEMWRELGEDGKRVYEVAAKRAKDRFAREMEAFKEGRCLEEEAEADDVDHADGSAKPMDNFDMLDAFLDVSLDLDAMLPIMAATTCAEEDKKDKDAVDDDTVDDDAVHNNDAVDDDADDLDQLDETTNEEASEREGAVEEGEALEEAKSGATHDAKRGAADGKGSVVDEIDTGYEGDSNDVDAFDKLDEFLEDEIAMEECESEVAGGARIHVGTGGSQGRCLEKVDESEAEEDADFDAFEALDSLL